MKTYTDITQSKKLAEILPLESADAFYLIGKEPVDIVVIYGFVTHKHLKEQVALKRAIPCWSLAALICVLPRYLKYSKGRCPLNLLTLDFENPHRKDHCWIAGYWDYDEEYEKYNFQMEAREGEVIDACYELILKLHEHKLLNK